MSPDPLTTLRASHPDLMWSTIPDEYARLLGTSEEGSISVGYIDDDQPEYYAVLNVGERRYTERGSAQIGVVAVDLADLRRAIGWPVGVPHA